MEMLIPYLEVLVKIFAIILLLFGVIFSSLGMLGLKRLPDIYSRLHATGKVTAFGAAMLVGAAVAVLPYLTIFKGLLIIIFLLVASPVVSHSISSAAYKIGLPLANPTRDDLADVLPRGTGKNV